MIEATDTTDQERTQDISLRETEGRKIEAEGREREWGSWGGGSKPPPHQLGSLGALWALPAGFGADPRPPQKFSTIFSTRDGLLTLSYCFYVLLFCILYWRDKTPVPPPCVSPCPWYIMASFYCYTTNLFPRVSIAMVAVCKPVLKGYLIWSDLAYI